MLTNRTFRFRVGDTLSPSFDQIESFPQGSVLSVLCFARAINDIVTAVPKGVSCSLYVDNFDLYLSGSTLAFAVHRMQVAINRVAGWTDSHGFRFPVEKSHAVVLDVSFWNNIIHSTVVLEVREVHFIGMIFDV